MMSDYNCMTITEKNATNSVHETRILQNTILH